MDQGWTLEEAAEQINALSGGGMDASRLSGWETGRLRTSLRYRRVCSGLFGLPVKELFAHQDQDEDASRLGVSGVGVVAGVLTRYSDVLGAMIGVVEGAADQLVATGSRTREARYLQSIEEAVEQRPELAHYRVLYGPPHHRVLLDHLHRLLELRDPALRQRGVQTMHIGLVDGTACPERFFVASERQAVVALPSLHGADGFDCGVVLGQDAAIGLVHHGREAYAAAQRLETRSAVAALPVLREVPAGGGV